MSGYGLRSETVDCGALYETIRADFVAMLRTLPVERLERGVGATPEWRVRDVVAHLAGLTEDLNRAYFGEGDPDGMTRAQVDRFRDSSLEEIIQAWDREAPAFEGGLQLFGYQVGNHFVGDLFIHVTDVRSALGLAVDRDSVAMWTTLDWYLDALDASLRDRGEGAFDVITAPEQRVVGTGTVVATVTAPAFEIARACAGRRSAGQIAAFAWTGDASRFLPLISQYSTPTADLVD